MLYVVAAITVGLAQSIYTQKLVTAGEFCVQTDQIYQSCAAGSLCYNEKCFRATYYDDNNCTDSGWTLGLPYADCAGFLDVCTDGICQDTTGVAEHSVVGLGENCSAADVVCSEGLFCSLTDGCYQADEDRLPDGTVCDPSFDLCADAPCQANTKFQVYTCGGTDGHIKGVGYLTTDGTCNRYKEGRISYCAEGYICGTDRKCKVFDGWVPQGGQCGKDVGTCGPKLWCHDGTCKDNPPKTLSAPIISIVVAFIALAFFFI